MGKNKGQETVQMYRWDQYNERWIPFTGSVGRDGRVYTVIAETAPTDTTKSNASIILSQTDNSVDSTKTLTKTIGATSYQRTLSFNAAGEFLSASVWSEI